MTENRNHKRASGATTSQPAGATKPDVSALPRSICHGTIDLGLPVGCHVLSTSQRVISQRDAVAFLSGGERRRGDLLTYIQSLENQQKSGGRKEVDKSADFQQQAQDLAEILAAARVPFSTSGGTVAHGITAEAMIDLCLAYQRALIAGALHPKQVPIARRACKLIEATAKLGIVATIDEATGFDKLKAQNAYQDKLARALRSEPRDWESLFPEVIWQEFARLERRVYVPGLRPRHWGKLVMAIYRSLDPEVAKALQAINPRPEHGRNHHQWLSDEMRVRLEERLKTIVAVAKTTVSMEAFRAKFGFLFLGEAYQMDMFDEDAA